MITLLVIYAAISGLSLGQPLKTYPFVRLPAQPTKQSPRSAREDINCSVLKPSNPDCCFMTDKNHERTQGSQPLHSSPYLMNLVSIDKKKLNKFEKVMLNDTVLWKLSPLKKDPYNRGEQIVGGPIKMQVSCLVYKYCKPRLTSQFDYKV